MCRFLLQLRGFGIQQSPSNTTLGNPSINGFRAASLGQKMSANICNDLGRMDIQHPTRHSNNNLLDLQHSLTSGTESTPSMVHELSDFTTEWYRRMDI